MYEWYSRFPSVTTDTRSLKPGDLFFALKGPNFNGNGYAQQALDKGAAACILDEKQSINDERLLYVSDVLTALQELALFHRSKLAIPFLAITGSNGKTTTKELIHAVLSSHYRTYTTTGNLNNHIGVPLTILRVRPDAEMAVIEMGANHQQEIAGYCRYTQPTHGLITNCGKAHLEGFGGIEGVRKGKGELFDHIIDHQGTLFVYNDYDYFKPMLKDYGQLVTYGTLTEATVMGAAVEGDSFLQVEMTRGLLTGIIRTKLVGSYNLPNVLAAITVGLHFGVPADNITTAIESYEPTNSRSQLIRRGSNAIVLDAYNANPSSMRLAIENFAKMPGSNKVLILGGMMELGVDTEKEHRDLLNLLQQYPWQAVILVGESFCVLHPEYPCFLNADGAADYIRSNPLENMHVLIKGSRSTQMEKVLEVF